MKRITINTYEVGLVFRKGTYRRILTEGVYWLWGADSVMIYDLTKPFTPYLELNIYLQDEVLADMLEVVEVGDNEIVLRYENGLLKEVLEYIGTLSLDELLEKKETIGSYVLETVGKNAEALGVEVTGFGIRDIILPGDVKEIMNQVLVAEKKAQANIIMRREETASTRSLLNTAKLMEDNQMLFKLKEMEYVEKIAEKINSISLSGNGVLIDQLRQIFIPQK